MATRNLTRRFKQLRENHKPCQLGQRGGGGNERLLDSQDSPNGWNSVTVEGGIRPTLPPVWVDYLEQIDTTLDGVEKNISKLKRLQQERLKFKFSDSRTDQDRTIDVLNGTITSALQRGNNLLKKIATVGNESGNLPYEERAVRINVMKAKAFRAQQLQKTLREAQSSFITSLQSGGTEDQYFDDDDGPQITLDDVSRGFSAEQMATLERRAQDADQREKEILNIAKSVNDLAQIFNELNVLVVQQGTVLDRIDYNIEQTVGQLRSANKEIRKAEDYQKRARSTLCIIVLVVLIMVCALILILKNM